MREELSGSESFGDLELGQIGGRMSVKSAQLFILSVGQKFLVGVADRDWSLMCLRL